MRVLVIGSSGLVGAAVVARLDADGYEVVRYDIDDGNDVLDAARLIEAAQGCAAIVNAAGGHRKADSPGEGYITHNVTGNFNVIDAATLVFVADLGLDRIVAYRFDAATGLLAPDEPPFVAAVGSPVCVRFL